jgi:WD40 repeat protein
MNKRLWILLLCLLSVASPLHAQSAVRESLRIGRGAVQKVEWHPDGSAILVDTIRGAWLYTPDLKDITHLEGARLGTFKPDGWLLAGVDDQNRITLWETKTWQPVTAFSGHTDDVVALAWSPDGAWLASADRSGLVLIWDVVGQKIVERLKLAHVNQIAWSPKGTYLAAANGTDGIVSIWQVYGDVFSLSKANGDFSVIRWRDDTHLLTAFIGSDGISGGDLWDVETRQADTHVVINALDVTYSPDGSKMAIAGPATSLIQDNSGNTVEEIELSLATQIAWSRNGKWVAFGTAALGLDGQVWVIDVIEHRKIQLSGVSIRTIRHMVWRSDNQTLLVTDNANQLTVWYFHPQVGTFTSSQSTIHSQIGNLVAWSPDAKKIVSANSGRGINLWDSANGTELGPVYSGTPSIDRLVWQPAGSLIAVTNTYTTNVQIWDMNSSPPYQNPIITIPHLGAVVDIAWSPDGKTLASAEPEQFIRLWSPQNPQVVKTVDLMKVNQADYVDMITGIGWARKDNLLYVAIFESGNGGSVEIVDPFQGRVVGWGANNYATHWVWSPENQFVWVKWNQFGDSASNGPLPISNTLTIGLGYSSEKGHQEFGLTGLSKTIQKAILSPDGTRVIAFDEGHTGMVWDITTRKTMFTLKDASDAVWSPDGRRLLVYNVDAPLSILDAQTGDMLGALNGHYAGAYESLNPFAVWSPDSRRLALLDQGVMFIYDVNSN